ncbi:hypothetical protein [Methylobacterium sp. 174MFSha1.1]|uniref:hypothetical protein n=1 Tax=Methylobacterium sp. 174MFSha1.1 TaxID=1502749 RepID=UPI001FCD0DF6|nr:hypothetical protein [Methylobacterium sp. 174MFSha1.1]
MAVATGDALQDQDGAVGRRPLDQEVVAPLDPLPAGAQARERGLLLRLEGMVGRELAHDRVERVPARGRCGG